jgi:hypothetical protein
LHYPANHAFVLQLQKSQGRPGTCRGRRVEHLALGHATSFTTTAELWYFVDRVLAAVTERRVQDPRRDSSENDDREDDS